MKKQVKKQAKEKGNNNREKIINEFQKLGAEISGLVKKAKDHYDKTDAQTKKKVIAGIAGAAALIAGVIGYKKMKGKK